MWGVGDQAANLTISSPLEAHKSHTLCFDMCGVDVGFENPLFACIELDYEDDDDNDDEQEVRTVRGRGLVAGV